MGMCIDQCVWSNCILSLAHTHVHVSVQTYVLLSGRCLRAASSRRPRQPPTRAATPTLRSRQHPHARSCIRTHDCGRTLALPGCDLVAPTPRVEETRPHSHAHMHLHVLRASCAERLLRYVRARPTAHDRERRRSSRPRRRSRSPSRPRPRRGSSRTRRPELARRSACYATPPMVYSRCTP